MRPTSAALVPAVVMLVAPASAARAVADFRTPGKTVYCAVVEAYETPRGYLPPLTCWRPRNGFTVFLRALHGARTEWNPRNKGTDVYAVRVLRFGRRWWSDKGRSGIGSGAGHRVVYRCVSRASGLTCTNRVGHGFWLGRYRGYRLF